MRSILASVSAAVLAALPSFAQQATPAPAPCVETMPGMQMCPSPTPEKQDGMAAMMANVSPRTLVQEIQRHASSGSTVEPNSTPAPMLMSMHGPWMLMLHGTAFATSTQQSGPRGADKVYGTNWVMPMAMRRLGPGQLTLRTMFSLEPATITGRQYPLLFQQGETAFGTAIVDGQHPHNFFMELAALYDMPLGEKTLLSFYVAPVGDPALGPSAYAHRQSASENPVGTLGHHQQDSTHIAFDVATVGVTHGMARVEVSGFHGREPNERRWTMQVGTMDSWSTRLTLQPAQNWSAQYSYGRITSPEALAPHADQARATASVMYNRPLTHGNWSNTVVWGRTRSIPQDAKQNSYLLESLLRFRTRNYVWTRLENAGRSDELLDASHGVGPELPIGHVQAYTLGYDRDIDLVPHLRSAVGAQVTTYGVPDPLRQTYGAHPAGVSFFVRFRPASGQQR